MPTSKKAITWTVRSPEDLGRAISGVRSRNGLTQADLASELGVDRQYLVRMEGGKNTLILERALRALNRMGAQVTVTLPEDDSGKER